MDSALYKAVSTGDHKSFVSLVNADPSLLHQKTTQKSTLLHVAAEFNQRDIVREILQRSLPILYVTNSKEDTALHIAARFGNLEVAEDLIDSAKRYGLEAEKELLTMVNEEGETALHDAARNGHCEVVKLLIAECGVLGGYVNGAGESPLYIAVEKGFMDVADEILRVSSSCSYRGREGANALHALVLRTQKRYTQSLIETPLRLYLAIPIIFINNFLPEVLGLPYWEWKNTRKLTPRQKELFAELLKNSQLQREGDDHGWLPLHYAANLGSAELVELILRHETSLAYAKDYTGVPALHIAAKKGRVGVIKTFIKYCPDSCELLDHYNRTAVHVAVENGQSYAVKQMLQIPSFLNLVNQQDSEGSTALHLAASSGNYAILMMLAANPRVDKKITNKKGLNTNDIIRMSTSFRWYEKSMSIGRLEFNGALQGMQQVLIRKPATEKQKREESVDADKTKENLTKESCQVTAAAAAAEEGKKSPIWGEVYEANLVVATIIATVTFSAAFQVPGGYNSDGLAVRRHDKYFKLYLITDSLSFGYAAASMFVTFFTGLFGKASGFDYPRRWVTFLTGTSLWFMVFSFLFGTSAVMAEDSGFAMLVRAVACFSFMWPVFLLGALAVNWFAYFS